VLGLARSRARRGSGFPGRPGRAPRRPRSRSRAARAARAVRVAARRRPLARTLPSRFPAARAVGRGLAGGLAELPALGCGAARVGAGAVGARAPRGVARARRTPMSWTFVAHVHTRHSFDSMTDPERLARHAVARGIHVLAVTDHDTWQGSVETRA